MQVYQDITLLPAVDIPLHFLWEKVYQQIHLALVETSDSNGKVNIGIAFPKYRKEKGGHPLGDTLRLLSMFKDDLVKLNIVKWFSRLSDYVVCTGIRDVPNRIDGHAHFKRLRPKGNNERLARRKAKREGISYDDALAYFKDRKVKLNNAPYVQIKSLSNNNRFRLMIDCVDADACSLEGFDTYGLSAKSTVPLF